MADLEPLLTRADVRKLLKVSRRTMDRLISSGVLPAGRTLGGSPRWFRADLESFLARLHRGDFEGAEINPPAPAKKSEGQEGPTRARKGQSGPSGPDARNEA